MRIGAVTAEFNPFHSGHRYILNAMRGEMGADAGILCLMSGMYVQRGEPAIFDPWTRAAQAAESGADLVLELPITYALNASGNFAAGAVRCFRDLGAVTDLYFGSESGDIAGLRQTAELLCSNEIDKSIRENLAAGLSYASARTQALQELGGNPEFLSHPNDLLNVDYLTAWLRSGGDFCPHAVRRAEGLPSATSCRESILSLSEQNECGQASPVPHALSYGERAVLAVLRSLPEEIWAHAPFGGEGLWSKVRKAAGKETSIDSIILAAKSKRYTYSRIRRMLLCLTLGLTEKEMEMDDPYLRVLAFNARGREMLHIMKKTSALPLLSGSIPEDAPSREYFSLEERAAALYGLFAAPGIRENPDFLRAAHPVFCKEVR